jgi:GTP-dependent dephospho-CoA kinase
MAVTHKITSELRVKLKEPFGILIKGTPAQTMAKMKTIFEKDKPPKLVSVGDTVSKNLIENKLTPDISVIDNMCMRKNLPPSKFSGKAVYIKNPAGTVTDEAVSEIKRALESQERIHLIVEGEEDLLVLVAVLYAPENALIVYGQPYEGIVVVKVTPQKKAEAASFLKAMEISAKS